MTGKVTRSSVQDYIEYTRKNYEVEKYEIDGIPEGFVFFVKKGLSIENMLYVGYLYGFTPMYDWNVMGAFFYMPIVVPKDSTDDEIKKETDLQAEKMLELYKDNVNKRNQRHGK